MKHLKLGTYSFIIDVDKLELESGTPKTFTREELPDELKSLFDIIQSNKVSEKSIFVDIQTTEYTKGGGYLTQNASSNYELNCSDGNILDLTYTAGDTISIKYTEI